MSISYNKSIELAGGYPIRVEPEWVYKAHLPDGSSVVCSSYKEALKHSKIVEEYIANKHLVDLYINEIRKVQIRAFNIWYNELRKDYNDLPDNVWITLYNKAESNITANNDFDGIAEEVSKLAGFVYDLKEAVENNF